MEFCLNELTDEKMAVHLSVYPQEYRDVDIISDDYFEQVKAEFGMRYLRGTAVGFHNPDTSVLYSTEKIFREFLGSRDIKRAVEIGTWRGVSTALIAHYAQQVTTVDITYYPEAMPVWMYFGIQKKIEYVVVENNEAKKQLLDRMDFDFAFIDGNHSHDEVAYDFELVRKCGRVLFHDYGIAHCMGVMDFVNHLPNEELIIKRPFAYWEKHG